MKKALDQNQSLKSLKLSGIIWAGLLAGVLSLCASAQQQSSPTLDPATQGKAIIQHLNSVIQFYRTVHEPLQKSGEPNDVIYRDQAIAQAAQIAAFAFQSAKAEAALLGGASAQAEPESNQQQRLATLQTTTEQRIAELQQRQVVLDKQIASASSRKLPALQTQKQQLQAALELSLSMKDALARISSFSRSAGGTGLAGDVARLQQSVPELQGSDNKTSAPQITSVESALASGVVTQAGVLLDLAESKHSMQGLLNQEDKLRQQATDLRAPIATILRGLIAQGQQLSDAAEAAVPATGAAAAPAVSEADLRSISTRFKALTAAAVPLSQEIIVLDQARSNFTAWQSSLDNEYSRILDALLVRILSIAVALAVIFFGSELWTRATTRYVRDLRRRRQFMIVRRIIVGFLSILVLVFGFFTHFNSLATFAGLITAGIAVGLQTILLSMAAYFFIIGRYGIRVGDRITVASVTGEVIEVGLLRFYVMELAGSSNELNPTGRVAVFSNAVLFQPATPLYKQMPGTGYTWHELTVRLSDTADYKSAGEKIEKIVESIYSEYQPAVQRQHQAVQNWMQTSIAVPEIESRLLLSGGVFQFWVRFPVEINNAAEADEKITHALLEEMAADATFKSAVASTPSIQASVRG